MSPGKSSDPHISARCVCHPAMVPLSRRHVLRGGAAGILAGACVGLAEPSFAQSTLGPDAALQQLIDGNQRFVDKRLTSFDEDLRELKENTAEKQEPFAA